MTWTWPLSTWATPRPGWGTLEVTRGLAQAAPSQRGRKVPSCARGDEDIITMRMPMFYGACNCVLEWLSSPPWGSKWQTISSHCDIKWCAHYKIYWPENILRKFIFKSQEAWNADGKTRWRNILLNTTRPCRKSTYFAALLIHIHQTTVNNLSYSEQYGIKSL